MAKIIVTLCDVQPCNRIADRSFQINGRSIHVCGEGCYVKYWSREYQTWKLDPYELQASHIAIYEERCSGRALKLVSHSAKLVSSSAIR
jgi:hypothetical protein